MNKTLAGLRVLVVEDEGLLLMLVTEFLTDLGCEIIATAGRLEDALIIARTTQADLAVLDINLAGKLSYPVAQLLHSRNIPFIFATGYGSLAIPLELQTAPVLAKPFRQAELAQALCSARFS